MTSTKSYDPFTRKDIKSSKLLDYKMKSFLDIFFGNRELAIQGTATLLEPSLSGGLQRDDKSQFIATKKWWEELRNRIALQMIN